MNIKIFFSVISAIIGIGAFYSYFRDVIKRQTQPHAFTWLLWAITQGTAAAGLWIGGGGVGVITLTISTFLVTLIFFLSLSDGKRNIMKSDVAVLVAALAAIGVWWLLNSPIFAVMMVSVIDVLGYIPTFRKSYKNPWTETILSWGLFIAANLFSILALENYNFLTLSYLTAMASANILLFVFLIVRRRSVPKPGLEERSAR